MTPSKTCQHCKFFVPNAKDETRGECNNEKIYYLAWYDPATIPIDTFAYWDAEGYSAYHRIGHNFGCIHWAEKE